jgi:hypothetical protein
MLLLRSEKQYSDVDYAVKYNPNFTIDMEFTGVEYIDLPISFNGITIKIITKNIPEKLNKYIQKDLKIFSLSNKNKQFYLVASSCIIGSSLWGLEKNRLDSIELNYNDIIYKI